jgi:hypothetical protein
MQSKYAAWIFLTISVFIHPTLTLQEFAAWTYLDFENNTASDYIPENNIFTGIQVFSNLSS